MEISENNLKVILGVRLRQLRHEKDLSLQELARQTGLSVSYISEIESGKKYPKPDKILVLAKVFGKAFDELVSTRVDGEDNPVAAFMQSPIVQEFPLQLFGITLNDVIELVKDSPEQASAFVRTLSEIGAMYDMRVEQFFFAALRSYQKMHNNYFEELETAADEICKQYGWKRLEPVSYPQLCAVLRDEYGYTIDEKTIEEHPDLHGFRSILIPGTNPRLLINKSLQPSQKAFVAGHELAYEHLKLKERPLTSSWLKVTSFEQVLNNFKASYFSGAILIRREPLLKELKDFFAQKTWDPKYLGGMMTRFKTTPEMFLYRLSQLIPKFFALDEIYFLRFNHEAGTQKFRLTKELNMSRFFVPHGIGLQEHYCRRWLSIRMLQQLAEKEKKTANPGVMADIQRSQFIDSGAEYLTISIVRPLALTEGSNSCITIGFLATEHSKKTIRFWDDPEIPDVEVNETCERCRLTDCKERAVPSTVFQQEQRQKKKEIALEKLFEKLKKKEAE